MTEVHVVLSSTLYFKKNGLWTVPASMHTPIAAVFSSACQSFYCHHIFSTSLSGMILGAAHFSSLRSNGRWTGKGPVPFPKLESDGNQECSGSQGWPIHEAGWSPCFKWQAMWQVNPCPVEHCFLGSWTVLLLHSKWEKNEMWLICLSPPEALQR